MTGSHEVSGSIPLISTKTKSHSVRNGFFVLAGHTWREKRCGSTECIGAVKIGVPSRFMGAVKIYAQIYLQAPAE